MTKTQITKRLETMLKIVDRDIADLLTAKVSGGHSDKTELLLDHFSIVLQYLILDAEASRRELFAVKKSLET